MRFYFFVFFVLLLLNIVFPFSSWAQFDDDEVIPDNVVTFSLSLEPESPRVGEHVRIIVDLKIHPESAWHIYSVIPGEDELAPIATTLKFSPSPFEFIGPVYESNPTTALDPVLGMQLSFHEKKARLFQNIFIPETVAAGSIEILTAKLRYQACSERICLPPKTEDFSLKIKINPGSIREEYKFPQYAVDKLPGENAELEEALAEGFWGFIGLAVIAGFLALLTPCVFPMIPITVAFFTKQEDASYKGTLRLASLFGIGIVGTYTATGMLLSMALGAAGAIQFATNGWVNLAIGGMFTIFALSLMGFIQLNAPGGAVTLVDQWSRKLQGPVGVLAMGLAFTLTSFTCTVQFVGTLLIAASQGLWFWPIVGMLVFSTVFAFPFFLLGLFPRMIQSFRSKSGSWMEHLKIILGLLELAAAFKFFSNTDLVWQLGIIDRDFVLITWILLSAVAALFLMGLIPIHHAKIEKRGIGTISSSLLFAFFGVYLFLGLGEKPLNPWVDTYLPPALQETASELPIAFGTNSQTSNIASHSLPWQSDLPQALLQAKAENKRIFIDFTGYTCVNCRWMEMKIFSQPEVMKRFKEEFVLVQLYTDGGKNAAANQRMQIARFKTVALPLYVILSSENQVLAKHAGILKPASEFLKFLDTKNK